ncbi:uncharacterized protein M421DRAFT_88685 [Didymella exigua CBS 183.55]|uniref:Uncharacterized protein n=1 Tax=Didymella exigua CBS 183.55 TaxID=1150837 RepID=A0A6A5RYP1_9PLEO|nr:uncharacterized protein M421DRAFT_88685 [Didymella exigua CBS 183.55]KAF1933481.1 hypothetical protein M421DRAFT_88685 [Didymella exigua CBS 183.55]
MERGITAKHRNGMSSSIALKYSIITLLLSASSYAQDSPQCSAIAPQLAYNASSSVTIPAITVSILGDPDDGDVLIRNVTGSNWTLSSYIQPHSPKPPDTDTYLWLDVGDSDLERLGRTMRACHTFVPLQFQIGGNVTWSYDTLEKSVQDTGDCRSMVSEECLARLRIQYFNAGTSERRQYSGCADINTTVPWECTSSGMLMPRSLPVPEFNSSLSSHFPHLLDNSTREGLNENSQLDYDLATNFPIMDIMTFFPTIPQGRKFRGDANRVQIACLAPGQVQQYRWQRDNWSGELDWCGRVEDDDLGGQFGIRFCVLGVEVVNVLKSSLHTHYSSRSAVRIEPENSV